MFLPPRSSVCYSLPTWFSPNSSTMTSNKINHSSSPQRCCTVSLIVKSELDESWRLQPTVSHVARTPSPESPILKVLSYSMMLFLHRTTNHRFRDFSCPQAMAFLNPIAHFSFFHNSLCPVTPTHFSPSTDASSSLRFDQVNRPSSAVSCLTRVVPSDTEAIPFRYPSRRLTDNRQRLFATLPSRHLGLISNVADPLVAWYVPVRFSPHLVRQPHNPTTPQVPVRGNVSNAAIPVPYIIDSSTF